MYGCIEVMNKTTINMADELLIEKLHGAFVHDMPKEAREVAEKALTKAIIPREKLAGLSKILAIYFSERDYLGAFFVVDKFLDDPTMTDHRGYLLLQKGRASEYLYEFDDALIYYCRGLASHIVPREIYFALWHGASLCLLYKQDFKQAELCCRRVLELDPNQWKAWNNLGVSLEHQNCLEEALSAYRKAVELSSRTEVPILHLSRFIERHPLSASSNSPRRRITLQ